MSQPTCPTCQTPLQFDPQLPHSAVCRVCNKRYRIKSKSPAPSSVTNHRQDPPMMPDLPDAVSEGGSVTPMIRTATPQQSGEPSTTPQQMRPRMFFAAIGGVIVVVLLVGIVWFLGFGGSGDGTGEVAQTDSVETANARPATPLPSDAANGANAQPGDETSGGGAAGTGAGGLIDLSDLMELDATAPDLGGRSKDTPDEAQQSRSSKPPAAAGGDRFGNSSLPAISGGRLVSIDNVVRVELDRFGFDSADLLLPAPAGRHLVKYRGQGDEHYIASPGFAAFYRQQRLSVTTDTTLDLERIKDQWIQVRGRFQDPVLPHLLGDAYWESGFPDSAVRFWKAAIRTSPGFAPSHLNLSYAYHQRGRPSEARRELDLAIALNIQDTYGIARHLTHMEQEIGIGGSVHRRYSHRDYLPFETLSAEATKVLTVLESIGKLAESAKDQAACLNNAGIYLLHEQAEPERATEFFLQALQRVPERPQGDERLFLTTIVGNLVRSARRADLPEADLYAKLESVVR